MSSGHPNSQLGASCGRRHRNLDHLQIHYPTEIPAPPGRIKTMRSQLAGAFALLFACAALPNGTQAENSSLAVIVFPGVQNLPMFAAQAKGFYARRGLNVEIKFTPNSAEFGLAEGRYQIAHSAVDNAFALKDKAGVDIAVV